jgi:hypothetical protein
MTKDDTSAPVFDLASTFLDIEAIHGGKWIAIGADFPGVEILARGFGTPEAKKLISHLERTAKRDDRLSTGQLTTEARFRIQTAVLARVCVTDWRGVVIGGKVIPFASKTLEGLLNEPRAEPFALAIINAVSELQQTRAQSEASVVGN